MSSAEAIAVVVDDLKAGRARVPKARQSRQTALTAGIAVKDPIVIDATAIHRNIIETAREIAIYEDHPCIPPPFDEFVVAFENTYGNVLAIHCSPDEDPDAQWETTEPVDWNAVRWRLQCFLWIGGTSNQLGNVETAGPIFVWRIAVYDDGQPTDVSWIDLTPDYEADWDTAMLVLLASLNFLGCRNVDLVEPQRPRAERRRLARIGDGTIRVKTIQVFKIGKATRGERGEPAEGGVPLVPVRGHMAHYGSSWGKGLLFGKYEGRFWVPQHARGDRANGETRNSYTLEPES